MKPRICECCGQVIAPEMSMGPVKDAIYRLVRKYPGINRPALLARIYTNSDGGPENDNIINVHVTQMNQKLKAVGVRVRGRKWHGYRVEAI